MKLSQAIRDGAQGMEQITYGSYYKVEELEGLEGFKIVGCCALYAAYVGVTNKKDFVSDFMVHYVLKEANLLPKIYVKHPMKNHEDELEQIVISLNDEYLWTFEQNAAWLESIGE